MSQLGWHKSSFSTGSENDCVEIAYAPGRLIRLRESDDPAQVIATGPAALATLLRTVKADRLTPRAAPRT
ncbi:DUF397 domain-containing protein [Streptomyces sp. HU2014]|uniref:DUF397 domain-containing protein n=1 Tax=Streptomyces TaxID=1883 RepID=UPI000B42E542|nr:MULTISPECIES: DUF397 domain-containing protein [Streptomyces]UQI48219.1 DUF397 domain-containing protein [Streptomyces sp. HU2014]